MASRLTTLQRGFVAQRLQAEMGKRGLTQASLAASTTYDERTIRNILKAVSVKDTTLYEVFATLQLDLDEILARQSDHAGGGIAPIQLGAYARRAVETYIGDYLTIRPAFSGSGNVIACATAIAWSEADSCLTFEERSRPDYTSPHTGQLFIPAGGGFVYLVSGHGKGWLRTALVSQLDTAGMMRGLILALHRVGGSMHVPASAPIVYVKRTDLADCVLGDLDPGSDDATARAYAEYRRMLAETLDQNYARLARPDAGRGASTSTC